MARELTPNEMLRSFRIEARLGAGGQAVTWRATDTRDGRAVVVKQLALSRAENWKEIDLFRRECAVLATLVHPAIPAFIDAFEETTDAGDSELFLVQELVPAPSLATLMRDGRRWTKDELVDLARRLLAIVGWLHAQNPPVVHRDIKPSNILRHADGRLALIDFTAVQIRLQSGSDGGSTVVGTHGFMAPEQLLGRALPASDLYAIGMTLVHLASGHHPGDLPLDGLRVDFRSVVRLDAPLVTWLERLTSPDPNARPASAEAALGELDRALAAPRPVVSPAAVPAPSANKPKRRWKRVALTIVIAGVLIGLATMGSREGATSASVSPTPSPVGAPATRSVMKRTEQFQDIATEIVAPPGLVVTMRAARLRLGGSLGEPTTVYLGYTLHNDGDTPVGRVRVRLITHAISTQTAASLEPVSVLQVPLEPGETRRESDQIYDVPRSASRVVLTFTTEPAPPLPTATPRAVAVAGMERMPPGSALTLVERRAHPVKEGLSGPRMVFDVELRLQGTASLSSLQLAPSCLTPSGLRPRNNDRDFTVILSSLDVRTLADGDVSTFRVLCPPDATAATWRLASVAR